MFMQWKTTTDPLFNDLRLLTRQMDAFGGLIPAPSSKPAAYGLLTVNESDEAFTVTAALPGATAEDIELDVEGGVLRIQARRSSQVPEGYQALRQERQDVALKRSVALGNKVDVDHVEAALEHGVLTVTLPKLPEQKPRAISIRTV